MLKNAKAKNFIKLLFLKRKLINTRLKKFQPWVRSIVPEVCFNGVGIIYTEQIGICMLQYNLGKPSGARANLKHIFISQIFLIPASDRKKTLVTLYRLFLKPVNLRFRKLIPLKTEISGIIINRSHAIRAID